MAYYMCTNCLRIFCMGRQLVRCPQPSCGCFDALAEVDELILPAIHILNKKGYVTTACCSGHYVSDSKKTYIMFDEAVELPSLPDGFCFDPHNKNVIESVSSGERGMDAPVSISDMFEVYDNIISLLRWAEGLPVKELY